MNPATQLSRNFSLYELLQSETAERNPELQRQQMNPPADVVGNLQYLTTTTLQPARDRLGYPIGVTSGYRCEELNRLIGGAPLSQHPKGEAADLKLSDRFLTEPSTAEVRSWIERKAAERSGARFASANANFYLFALFALGLDFFDVDQLIHEYGQGYGRPAWVHVSASRRQNKRQVLVIAHYSEPKTRIVSAEEALRWGATRA